MGPFRVVKRVGPAAYELDLSHSAALRLVHPVFHVNLLRDYADNGLHQQPPPIEVEGDQEFEIEAIVGHRVYRGQP